MNTGHYWKKIGAIVLIFCLLAMASIPVQAAPPATDATLLSPDDYQLTAVTVTLTFDGNGHTGGKEPTAKTGDAGTDVTLPNAGTDADTLIKTGYTFAGWNTAKDGSGTSYAAGASYKLEADVTLYAKWELLPDPIITFNGNGHKSGTVPAEVTGKAAESITLPGNTGNLGKDGYAFAGWNTAADGSGTTYQGGAALPLPSSDLILYAKWEKAALIDDPDDLTIEPEAQGITDGETVTVDITGFGNRYNATLYSIRLVIKPPVGLNLVKGTVPVLTDSAGVTYDITCKTNTNNANQLFKSKVSAAAVCSFDAPPLGTGEYITELAFLFHDLPVGFAIGDKMELDFKLTASQVNQSAFTMQGSVNYTLAEGDQEVEVTAKDVDFHVAVENSSSSKSSSSNSGKTIDTTPIPKTNNMIRYGLFALLGAAAFFLIVMILNRRGNQRVRH